MQTVTYYLLKAVISVALLFLMAFAAREMYRIWFVQRTALAPFAYQKDGVENGGQGKAFSQRVYQELRGLLRLLVGDGGKQMVKDLPAAQKSRDDPKKVKTLELPQLPVGVLPIGPALVIPEIREIPLAGIEMKVQGIDFASLARNLFQWADPPDEFTGIVIEASGSFDSSVEWRRKGRSADASLRLAADRHPSLEDSAFATACNILYLLIDDRDKEFSSKLSRVDFQIFARAIRCYSTYLVIVTEMRPAAAVKKARASLEEADRLLSGLVGKEAGERFSSIYIVAAMAKIAMNEPERARECLVKYRLVSPGDDKADGLEKMLPPLAVSVDPTRPVNDQRIAAQKHRPVRPGVSASGSKDSVGTICCIVKSRKDSSKCFLLSSNYVFGEEDGSAVIQPGFFDGGHSPEDEVAKVVKHAKRKAKALVATGALAVVPPTADIEPKCLGVGAFKGTADAVLGEDVRLVGRTSGVVRGRVDAIQVDATIYESENKHVKYEGLVACQGMEGGSLGKPGDGGAPVLNARNELIGMQFAGSETQSYFVPIKPLLEALDVELVTE